MDIGPYSGSSSELDISSSHVLEHRLKFLLGNLYVAFSSNGLRNNDKTTISSDYIGYRISNHIPDSLPQTSAPTQSLPESRKKGNIASGSTDDEGLQRAALLENSKTIVRSNDLNAISSEMSLDTVEDRTSNDILDALHLASSPTRSLPESRDKGNIAPNSVADDVSERTALLQHTKTASWVAVFRERLGQSYAVLAEFLGGEKPLGNGKRRVWWKCVRSICSCSILINH